MSQTSIKMLYLLNFYGNWYSILCIYENVLDITVRLNGIKSN